MPGQCQDSVDCWIKTKLPKRCDASEKKWRVLATEQTTMADAFGPPWLAATDISCRESSNKPSAKSQLSTQLLTQL